MPIDVNCSAWKGFRTGEWRHLVNVRNFIQKNYTPYAGDESFLAPTSERTQKVWGKSHELILEEQSEKEEQVALSGQEEMTAVRSRHMSV